MVKVDDDIDKLDQYVKLQYKALMFYDNLATGMIIILCIVYDSMIDPVFKVYLTT
jgi:hypothetical protein